MQLELTNRTYTTRHEIGPALLINKLLCVARRITIYISYSVTVGLIN